MHRTTSHKRSIIQSNQCSFWIYELRLYSSVSSVTQSCLTLRPHGLQQASLPCPSLSSRSLLKLMSMESVMPSEHLIFCHPLLLPPSIFPSIRVFSKELALHIRWPKYCSFSFSITTSLFWKTVWIIWLFSYFYTYFCIFSSYICVFIAKHIEISILR